MDLGLGEWTNILKQLGFPVSTIIMAVMWWFERQERMESEKQHRLDREADREEMKDAFRDSIQSNQNVASVVSTLTSLLSAGPRGRG